MHGPAGPARPRAAPRPALCPSMPPKRLAAAPTETPAAGLPTLIGKYRVVRKLGEGATSEVFLAHDPFNDVDVAIKRVRTGLLADSRESHFQQRFFAAEAALVGRLHHPNVVQILDAVADAEAPYLVMEYVDGGTLRRFCRADRLLPLQQILEIGFKSRWRWATASARG